MPTCPYHNIDYGWHKCPLCEQERHNAELERVAKAQLDVARESAAREEAREEALRDDQRRRLEGARAELAVQSRNHVHTLYEKFGPEFCARYYLRIVTGAEERVTDYAAGEIKKYYEEYLSSNFSEESGVLYRTLVELEETVNSAKAKLASLDEAQIVTARSRAENEAKGSAVVIFGCLVIGLGFLSGAYVGWTWSEGWFFFRPFFALVGATAGAVLPALLLVPNLEAVQSRADRSVQSAIESASRLSDFENLVVWYSGEKEMGTAYWDALAQGKSYITGDLAGKWDKEKQSPVSSVVKSEISLAKSYL